VDNYILFLPSLFILEEVLIMIPTILVSGYPRTGTSVMMRMLVYGGLEAIANKENVEDSGPYNPNGTYETNNVRNVVLAHDQEFFSGKAFKIVAPYMKYTWPPEWPAKVIFMQRDITEIIASLLQMGSIYEDLPDECIYETLEWLRDNKFDICIVKYKDLIKYPKSTASLVAEFLSDCVTLDVDKMVEAVDQENPRSGDTKNLIFVQPGRVEPIEPDRLVDHNPDP